MLALAGTLILGAATSVYGATKSFECTQDPYGSGGSGANHSGPYDDSCDGTASLNGSGTGKASGRPCAGCVGKADEKNPKGQYDNGGDSNSGTECDGNKGIGLSNPAHTACKAAAPSSTDGSTGGIDSGAGSAGSGDTGDSVVLDGSTEGTLTAASSGVVPGATVLGAQVSQGPAGGLSLGLPGGALATTGSAMFAALMWAAIACLGSGASIWMLSHK